MKDVNEFETDWNSLKEKIQNSEASAHEGRLSDAQSKYHKELITLLDNCTAFGGELSNPVERSHLQNIAREMGDAIFKLFGEYRPSALNPYRHLQEKRWPRPYYSDTWPQVGEALYGREQEIEMLNAALKDSCTNILVLIGLGGLGKTSLVSHWLTRCIQQEAWGGGAACVFAWSFAGQVADGKPASGEEFINEGLRRFGDTEMVTSGASFVYRDKGRRLAELIQERPTLLILDSLEPLQELPEGNIADQAVRTLLLTLAQGGLHGLCVVTTRLSVRDLEQYQVASVKMVALSPLSSEAGAEYLKYLGVDGTDSERMQASAEYNGHALTLTLLGRYLATVYKGDIRLRDRIPGLIGEPIEGSRAKFLMDVYERWFEGKPEQQILYILGLFDHPIGQDEIQALLTDTAITNISDRLQGLTEEQWEYAKKQLLDLNLVSGVLQDNRLVCHPLVREYFASVLKNRYPDSWQEAHQKLHAFYNAMPEAEYPDSVEKMKPLYAAVRHGCLAGMHGSVWDDIYIKRIQRGEKFYNTSILGAIADDLAILANFFDRPWLRPSSSLPSDKQGLLLHHVGFDLRALGRLDEATKVLEAALVAYKNLEAWRNATRAAGHLSNLYLIIGDLVKAEIMARKSMELANMNQDDFEKMLRFAPLGSALHQQGQIKEAVKAFREAESLQQQITDDRSYPLLYSVRGYQYCELLLDQGKCEDVLNRVDKTLQRSTAQNSLLDIGLDHLSLGRAHAMQVRRAHSEKLDKAAYHLDRAIDSLRRAKHENFFVQCLIERAGVLHMGEEKMAANQDLTKAWEIASRSGMRLLMADIQLKRTWFSLDENNISLARESLGDATMIINETGYHRKDPERLLCEADIQLREGAKEKTSDLLDKARKTIIDMHFHCWDYLVEELEAQLLEKKAIINPNVQTMP